MTLNTQSSPLFVWFLAMRPWSFTASIIPVSLGVGIAWLQGQFHPGLFLLTLLGAVALQAGTNFFNTFGDYVAKVDSIASAPTCPQLVTGQLRPESMHRAGWVAFCVACAAGMPLLRHAGWPLLLFGLAGALGGYYYTMGSKPYKYSGYGPFCVFILMGPLMTLPAFFIQTGRLSLAPVLASLSVSCLVTAIMHGNDMRDIPSDRAANIITLSTRLGARNATRLYTGLTLGAYVALVAAVYTQALPVGALLPFALLPKLLRLLARLPDGRYPMEQLEGWTARFHMEFGLCLLLGLVASRLLY